MSIKAIFRRIRRFLLLALCLCPLVIQLEAQPASTQEIVRLNFSQLQEILIQADFSNKIATTDSLGRNGIFLIPDAKLEWDSFKRPNPDTLSLYSFYPEEIFWYRVRHWLEFTELKAKNQQLDIRLQSRHVGDERKTDYLIHLKFKRSLDGGWTLISSKIYDMD